MRHSYRYGSRALIACFVGLLTMHCSAGGGGGSNGNGGGSGTSGGEQNLTPSGDDAGSLEGTDGGATTMATDAGIAPVADGGGTGVTTNVPQDFPIAPLHLAPTNAARNADAQVDVELRADGSIYSHGQHLGQISGRRVVSPTGREILAVAPDGTVVLGGNPIRARLREDGDMQMPTGAVLTFNEDGTPVAIGPNQQRENAPMRVTGFRNDLRRTAALLAIIAATVPTPH